MKGGQETHKIGECPLIIVPSILADIAKNPARFPVARFGEISLSTLRKLVQVVRTTADGQACSIVLVGLGSMVTTLEQMLVFARALDEFSCLLAAITHVFLCRLPLKREPATMLNALSWFFGDSSLPPDVTPSSACRAAALAVGTCIEKQFCKVCSDAQFELVDVKLDRAQHSQLLGLSWMPMEINAAARSSVSFELDTDQPDYSKLDPIVARLESVLKPVADQSCVIEEAPFSRDTLKGAAVSIDKWSCGEILFVRGGTRRGFRLTLYDANGQLLQPCQYHFYDNLLQALEELCNFLCLPKLMRQREAGPVRKLTIQHGKRKQAAFIAHFFFRLYLGCFSQDTSRIQVSYAVAKPAVDLDSEHEDLEPMCDRIRLLVEDVATTASQTSNELLPLVAGDSVAGAIFQNLKRHLGRTPSEPPALALLAPVSAGKTTFLDAFVYLYGLLSISHLRSTARLCEIRFDEDERTELEIMSQEEFEEERSLRQAYVDALEKEDETVKQKRSLMETMAASLHKSSPVEKAKKSLEKFEKAFCECSKLVRPGTNCTIRVKAEEETSHHIKKFVDVEGDYTCVVKRVLVYRKLSILRLLRLLDTPGIDSKDKHQEIAAQGYEEADMIVWLNPINHPDMAMPGLFAQVRAHGETDFKKHGAAIITKLDDLPVDHLYSLDHSVRETKQMLLRKMGLEVVGITAASKFIKSRDHKGAAPDMLSNDLVNLSQARSMSLRAAISEMRRHASNAPATTPATPCRDEDDFDDTLAENLSIGPSSTTTDSFKRSFCGLSDSQRAVIVGEITGMTPVKWCLLSMASAVRLEKDCEWAQQAIEYLGDLQVTVLKNTADKQHILMSAQNSQEARDRAMDEKDRRERQCRFVCELCTLAEQKECPATEFLSVQQKQAYLGRVAEFKAAVAKDYDKHLPWSTLSTPLDSTAKQFVQNHCDGSLVISAREFMAAQEKFKLTNQELPFQYSDLRESVKKDENDIVDDPREKAIARYPKEAGVVNTRMKTGFWQYRWYWSQEARLSEYEINLTRDVRLYMETLQSNVDKLAKVSFQRANTFLKAKEVEALRDVLAASSRVQKTCTVEEIKTFEKAVREAKDRETAVCNLVVRCVHVLLGLCSANTTFPRNLYPSLAVSRLSPPKLYWDRVEPSTKATNCALE